ncbi:MAG: chloride channel protein [Lachnospiraceae bacterium]|nr:chloride channel protein [Lachnospiraceae bacterium]
MEEKKTIKGYVNDSKRRIKRDMGSFFKWLILAVLIGVIVGGASIMFAHVLTFVTHYRTDHTWTLLGLPLAGLIIVFLYDKFGKDDGGVNQVFSTIKAKDHVPAMAAPLIFVATALTHLTGGSAGREGAAVQLGGSIAGFIGRFIPLDEEDRHVMVMCGMSAAFAALFGTPMAAALFALEVVSVGVMYYGALMPCMIASLVASGFSANMGVHAEAFHVHNIPEFTVINAVKMGIIALLCAAVSIAFCVLLKKTGEFYKKYLKNKYIRVVVAALVVIAITCILQTADYMGAGANLIIEAIEHEQAKPTAFFIKMLLTAITMKAGFKGGEIVPSFSIGATFGCVLGGLLGIGPSVAAACGMVAVFCGVTNCPLTATIIAFEMFGFEGASFYVLAVAVCYATSGYYSLYKEQTIVYSKYKAKFVNHPTR